MPLPAAAQPDSFAIYYSGAKLVKSVLSMLLAAVIVLTCGGLIHPRWFGWCLVALGVLILVMSVGETAKFFRSAPAVLLTREGLNDHSQKPVMFIPWTEIQKVTLHTLRVNGLLSSRKLILNIQKPGAEMTKRQIDLDTLKGNPKAIAETVLVWTNHSRPAGPMPLQEDMSDKANR
jgi:hypothetical protein